jgi:hypothetical protein
VLRVVDCGDRQLVVLEVDGNICVLQPVQGNRLGGLCGTSPRTDAGIACGGAAPRRVLRRAARP